MAIRTINEKIKYIAATNDPLSADIGIITGKTGTWLFDVGADEKVLTELNGKYNIVISHFHQDHTGNISRILADNLYVSKETAKHIPDFTGNIVSEDLYLEDIHIFPIPSSHSKGCLGLEVDGEYAFVGDALYSKVDPDYYLFNAQLLKDEINILNDLHADKLLVSHYGGLVRDKSEVLEELVEIYSLRTRDDPLIRVPREG